MLGDARCETAGADLAELLADPNPRVKTLAAIAIGRIKYAPACAPFDPRAANIAASFGVIGTDRCSGSRSLPLLEHHIIKRGSSRLSSRKS